MALTKKTITDKIETVKVENYYILQVREAVQVLENGNLFSQNFNRYTLAPNTDVSTLTDDIVKAQFNVIMTSEVKANYEKYLAQQNALNKPE
tara:strand:+ start:107 stop:382 length:276 start_codon:yes stop_codon:yes gene_type:complete